MAEIWKWIAGYRRHCKVSNKGRVKSVTRKVWSSKGFWVNITGRILQQRFLGKGKRYLATNLSKRGMAKTKTIHRLVAETFIPNPKNKPEINHKDGCRTNNSVSNLEWVTKKENAKHAKRTGLLKKSKRSREYADT